MTTKTTDPDFIDKQIRTHKPIANDILDDPNLIKLQNQVKTDLKEFSFKLFGRTFRFETYTIKEKHTISEPVDICQSSNQAAFICNNITRQDELTKKNLDYILSIPDLEYKEKVDKLNNKL